MKIVIFTAVFGEYKRVVGGFPCSWTLSKAVPPPPGWDFVYVLVTDNATLESNPALSADPLWTICLFDHGETSPRMAARRVKMMAYPDLLPPHDVSIWIDSNVSLCPDTCFHHFRSLPLESPLWTLTHPARTCTYQEIEHCYQKGFGNPVVFREQRRALEDAGFPPSLGLAETRILGRHPTASVRLFNEAWWTWFTLLPGHHLRDQCAFVPALWTCSLIGPKGPTIPLVFEDDLKFIFRIQRQPKAREEAAMKVRHKIKYK